MDNTRKKIQDLGYTGKKHVFDGIILIGIGILLFIFKASLPRVIISWLIACLFLLSLWNLVLRIWKKDENETVVSASVKAVIFYILSLGSWFENVTVSFVVFIIGIYQLFLACINGITYIIYKKDGISPRFRYLRAAIWWIIIGIYGIISPITKNYDDQMIVLSVYLISLGWTNVRDGLFFTSDSAKKNIKRRVRMSLPIALAAFVPVSVLNKINDYLQNHKEADVTQIFDQVKDTATNDLQVFIHVSQSNMFGAMGHVDICYKGVVYAYGNYDMKSERLFGSVGDGVLFTALKESYIAFCQKEDNKTIFEYGITLSDMQRSGVEQQLSELLQLCVPFAPSSELLVQKNGQQLPMYSYRLKHEINAQLYKFVKSKFKTYFVLSTNCVLLADSVIGKAGTDILNPKGFIAPGTYQEYLDREYERPNSIVVSKKVYYSMLSSNQYE